MNYDYLEVVILIMKTLFSSTIFINNALNKHYYILIGRTLRKTKSTF